MSGAVDFFFKGNNGDFSDGPVFHSHVVFFARGTVGTDSKLCIKVNTILESLQVAERKVDDKSLNNPT